MVYDRTVLLIMIEIIRDYVCTMHIFIAVAVFTLYPIHISGQSVPYHFPYTESIKQQF